MTKGALIPGSYYHIYNHAVGSDKLFLSDDNYLYFLKRYQHFVSPVADTLAYCLMPNHVHLFVEIRQDIQLPAGSKYEMSKFVSKQFGNLFSSYSQAFNKQQRRFGNLFMSNFRRKVVDNDNYFTNLILYIHLNPVRHGFVDYTSKWKYSSYNLIDSPFDSFVEKDKVLAWFNGSDEFNRAHAHGTAGQLPESLELSGS